MSDLKSLMLGTPRWSIAVAESLTSGRLQSAIGAVSGASEYFAGGITTYNLDQKVRHLGVDRATAEAVNCVSEEVAREMALGVCRLFRTTFGISTTGYAEPWLAAGIRAPFAWWAIAQARENGPAAILRVGRIECADMSRIQAQATVAEAVLAELIATVAQARRASETPDAAGKRSTASA